MQNDYSCNAKGLLLHCKRTTFEDKEGKNEKNEGQLTSKKAIKTLM